MFITNKHLESGLKLLYKNEGWDYNILEVEIKKVKRNELLIMLTTLPNQKWFWNQHNVSYLKKHLESHLASAAKTISRYTSWHYLEKY